MLSNKYVVGALTGLWAAVVVDLDTFRNWKQWDEVKSFNWFVALKRYAIGALMGALAAAGLGSVS